MEYMDAGSLDRLEGAGVPEDVLARIAGAMVRGLKFLKDNLQVIHRGASQPVFDPLILTRNNTNNRCETHKRSRKPTRSYQALRFWRIRATQQEHRTDSYWVPIVYGGILISLSRTGSMAESVFSPNESKGNLRTRKWLTLSRPTSGPSVSPSSSSQRASSRTHQRRTRTSLLS